MSPPTKPRSLDALAEEMVTRPAERPILFSGEMVRAILDGRKTCTRRVVSDPRNMIQKIGGSGDADNDPGAFGYFAEGPGFSGWMVLERGVNDAVGNNQDRCSIPGPYDAERLWVRETWRTAVRDGICGVEYAADGAFIPIADTREAADAWVDDHQNSRHGVKWRPSIFMRRWASRLALAVESIRVERLQDISEEDARAEGVTLHGTTRYMGEATAAFRGLWQSINGARPGCSWDENPFCWVVTFRRVDGRA